MCSSVFGKTAERCSSQTTPLCEKVDPYQEKNLWFCTQGQRGRGGETRCRLTGPIYVNQYEEDDAKQRVS